MLLSQGIDMMIGNCQTSVLVILHLGALYVSDWQQKQQTVLQNDIEVFLSLDLCIVTAALTMTYLSF